MMNSTMCLGVYQREREREKGCDSNVMLRKDSRRSFIHGLDIALTKNMIVSGPFYLQKLCLVTLCHLKDVLGVCEKVGFLPPSQLCLL